MRKSVKSAIAGAMALTLFAINTTSLSPMPADAASAFSKHQLENYPCNLQGIGNCWAAASASMYAYKRGSRCANEEMYSKFHDVYGFYPSNSEGINLFQAEGLLKHVFEDWRPGTYEVHKYLSPLTQNTIKAQIDNDMPVYITGYRYEDGAKVGHAVALVGYKKGLADGNVYGIYCMNPQIGDVQYAPYAEGSSYLIKHGNGVDYYTWDQSITIF
ncbi:MAG: hypothetical protein J6K77_08995 [Ruminococcus sp.]|nr:hypothetical protein [Ruminococcus sp.]